MSYDFIFILKKKQIKQDIFEHTEKNVTEIVMDRRTHGRTHKGKTV